MSHYKQAHPITQQLFATLAVITVVFHLWLIFSGLLPNLITRPLHMLFAVPWAFFSVQQLANKPLWYRLFSYALGVVAVIILAWIAINRNEVVEQYGILYGHAQLIGAGLLLVITLEMARRQIKAALPIVALCAIAYAAFGRHIPGNLGHNIPFEAILGDLTITEAGLWGMLTGTSVNTISVFIILGAAISCGLGGTAFMSLAQRLAGHYRAGAAKVAILSSALFGSISGSASANVASTGAITIPAMKRLGYPAPLSAAVEATASTGGQIMPPLMGAGAFVMVELLQTSYTTIMAAAFVPAILFFVIAWIGVDRLSTKYDLQPVPKSELPDWPSVTRLLPFFLIPFSILLFMLFFTQKTPQYGAGLAAFAAIALLIGTDFGKISLWQYGRRVIDCMMLAAQQIAMMASIIICVGIIIGILNQTGLGIKIASGILGLSAGIYAVALILTALTCLVLGMEIPTTAAYIICIAVAEPILLSFGMPQLTAHLFVYWYALLSCITPPVCGTVFIAATMANADWTKVAVHAMRLGLGLYLLPMAFATNPQLLTFGQTPLLSLMAGFKAGFGCLLVIMALTDKLSLKAISLFFLGVAILLIPLDFLTLLN
ncbi:TRAP transporter permease [Ostreibacterium oceani]|uniref:TRAP transporter fused permease subunit n=1 Tax=Ostreibacterium oceani TaxID=2654998 RepID=A0A6N7EUE9_9GAMM|nr:TRAP transporter fused permease subunit [Ostreibacterium oceani]MPV86181.1 TRAP transporter fused permease subunit [Ostreibacterium oceani]